MGLIDRLKSFFGGNDIDGAGRSQPPATSEWLDSERFAQERDAMLAWNRANPALSVEESERFAQEGDPLVAALRRKPERYVEGQKEWRGDPTWEEVELYLRKALINKREFVLLNLSYPKIPYIQACRESNPGTNDKMFFEVCVQDELTGRFRMHEKIVDADECRDAFRLYFESGEVRNLDDYTPGAWVNP